MRAHVCVQAIARDVEQKCAPAAASAPVTVIGGWTVHPDGGRTYSQDDAKRAARRFVHAAHRACVLVRAMNAQLRAGCTR
jgi:hypothetical protein